MTGKSKVDILCPVHNGERFLDKLFNCLLHQTYDNICIIIENGNSTDSSYEIMKKYEDKVRKRGYEYIVLDEPTDTSLASGYNFCLEHASSDYIIQIDCDDEISETAIEEYVRVLDERRDIGFVRANGWMHYVESNKKDILFTDLPSVNRQKQFEEKLYIFILTGEAYLAPPCSYMYRRECLLDIYNDLKIDPSRLGQNYQVLLPLSYKFKGAYIYEPLFWYTIRHDSLAHAPISKEEDLWRIDESARLIISVLENVGAPKQLGEKYAKLRVNRLKLHHAYEYKDKEMSKKCYKYLKENWGDSYSYKKEYLSTQYYLFRLFRETMRHIHIMLINIMGK